MLSCFIQEQIVTIALALSMRVLRSPFSFFEPLAVFVLCVILIYASSIFGAPILAYVLFLLMFFNIEEWSPRFIKLRNLLFIGQQSSWLARTASSIFGAPILAYVLFLLIYQTSKLTIYWTAIIVARENRQ